MLTKDPAFRMRRSGRPARRSVLPSLLLFLLMRSASWGMTTGAVGNINAASNNQVKVGFADPSRLNSDPSGRHLRRTFKPVTGPGRMAGPNVLPKPGADTPIEITYQDLTAAYALGNDLEYNYSENEEGYGMNIGSPDTLHAQHWVMPDCELEDWEYGEGVAPSGTPYRDRFPSATHCKVYEYEDEKYYEYYEFTERSVRLIGFADVVTEEDEEEVDFETVDLLIAPLTLTIHTAFNASDSVVFDDRLHVYDVKITPYGFGTLTTPEGDLEVLAMLNDFNERVFEGSELVEENKQPIIVFISKEGHEVDVWLEEDTEPEGVVAIDWLEYTWIVDNQNNVETGDRLPSEMTLFQNYPNPFNPGTFIPFELKKADRVSLKVYDTLGKEVVEVFNGDKPAGVHAVRFDGGRLPAGVYFYELRTNRSRLARKLTLMK